MVLNSDGVATTAKNDPNGVEVKQPKSNPMGKISSTMQSAPQQPKFETKEEEREYIKFRLAQGMQGYHIVSSSCFICLS